jgi:hypothetical protein
MKISLHPHHPQITMAVPGDFSLDYLGLASWDCVRYCLLDYY